MSVFDGFAPTLTVSSNSVVNLDGYRSLKIENGAAVSLDATKLTTITCLYLVLPDISSEISATANVQYHCRTAVW
jgi:hypothetical protein